MLAWLLREDTHGALLVLGLSLLASACQTGMILLLAGAVADLGAGTPPAPGLALGFLSLWLTYGPLKQQALVRGVALSENLAGKLGLGLAERLRGSSLETLERLGEARLQGLLSHDLRQLGSIGTVAIHALQSTLLLLFCWFALLWQATAAALLLVEIAALGRLALWQINRRLREAGEHSQALAQYRSRLTAQLLGGFKEIKLNQARRRSLLEEHLTPVREAARSARLASAGQQVLRMTVFNWLFFPGLILVTLVLPGFGASGLAMAAVVLVCLWLPMLDVLGAYPHLQTARQGLARLRQLETELQAPTYTTSRPQEPPVRWQEITFESVTFSYHAPQGETVFTLGPLDFRLRRGETVFITGANGSGKTTFLKLLCGLYQPAAGAIRVDQRAPGEDDYRGLFAAVFGDFHLFRRLYGLEAVEDSLTARWLARLDLANNTAVEDGVFSTTRLSTGQRKRLALMVACLEERPVLVFDEWSAEQDPTHRRWFYQDLLPELRAQGKTVICATHDRDYLHCADQVLSLNGN